MDPKRLKVSWKIVLIDLILILSVLIYFYFNGELTSEKITFVIIFGLIMGLSIKGFYEKFNSFYPTKTGKELLSRIHIKIDNDEKSIREVLANHFKGWEAVGGKLVLTDKRLVFKSHNFNIQRHEQTIPLEQIQNLSEGMSLKKYKNVLLVELVNTEKHKFIVDVDTPLQWIEEIERLKNSPLV